MGRRRFSQGKKAGVLVALLILAVFGAALWPRAISLLYKQRGVIAFSKAQAELQTNRGRGLLLLQQAEGLYLRALRWDGSDASAYAKLGAIYLVSGQPREALDYLTRASKLSPGDRQAWLWLGMANSRAGRPQLAAEQFGRAGAFNQLFALGNRYADAGDNATASDIFREAVKVRPQQAFPYLKLGETEEARGNKGEAVAAYRSFVKLEKENLTQKYLVQARLAVLEERWAEAATGYEKALGLASQRTQAAPARSRASDEQILRDPDIRFYLGIAYHETGKLDDALRELQEAIRLGPESKWYYRRLGDVYFDQGAFRESRDWYRKVLQIDPTDWRATERMRDMEALQR